MQETALDRHSLISTQEAHKQKNYLCPECGFPVRLRRGPQRSPHFYHVKAPRSCSQAKKGVIHFLLQKKVCELLKDEGAKMEVRFPNARRIADVCCTRTKKVFEIQYSPITLKEARSRTRDYREHGYEIVWILHDHRFNRRFPTPAEKFLRSMTCCYYTNFDINGDGVIYDQINWRYRRVVQLGAPLDVPESYILSGRKWPICHTGDWLYRGLHKEKIPSEKKNRPKASNPLEAYLNWLDDLLMEIAD